MGSSTLPENVAGPEYQGLRGASRVRWLIFALCCSTSWMLYLHRYTFGLIMPLLEEEYGWSPETVGDLAGIFNLSYAVGQVPSGMVCDWFGPHLFLGTIIVGWSAGLWITSAAATVPLMYGARLYFGFLQAGCYPALSKMTRMWFPVATRTSAQGWIASFFGRLGGACSNILFGTVLLSWMGLGWRTASLVLMVGGILFGLLFLLLARDSPSKHPWANEAEQRLVDLGESVSTASMTRVSLPWRVALRNGNFVLFLIQQFVCVFPDLLYVYMIPKFLLQTRGFDTGEAGIYASLPLIGGALGGSFAGMFQDYLLRRTGNRRWSRSLMGIVGNILAGGLMLSSLLLEDGRLVMVVLGLVKFFADWNQPTCWGTVTDIAGPFSGTAFGLMNAVGAVAGTLSPSIMARIVAGFGHPIDDPHGGWVVLFFILGLFYFLAALLWTFIDCEKKIAPESWKQ